MKTAILYARVATIDQAAGRDNVLQQQVEELIVFCKENKIEVEICFREIASGDPLDRPIFNQMLLNIERGHVKADMILFTRWNRFSRIYSAAIKTIKKLRMLNIKAKSIQDFESEVNESFLIQILSRQNEKGNKGSTPER